MFYHFADVETERPRLYVEGEIMPSEPWVDTVREFMLPGQFITPPAFRDALKMCEGKDLTVVVDSQGGDYAAGLAIHEALRAHRGSVTVHIYRAYSAATLIALGADKRLISPGGSIMIHSPMCEVAGKWQDMRAGMDFLLALRDSAAQVYARYLPYSQEELIALMDQEAYWSSGDAVERGWASGLIGEEEARATMRQTMRATMRATKDMIQTALNRAAEDKERSEILRALNERKDV